MICPSCKETIADNEESCPICGAFFGYQTSETFMGM